MSSIECVLFDLDDTLYDEIDFVSDAFDRVSRFVASWSDLPAKRLADEMMEVLQAEGRGRVFDRIVERHRLPSSWVVRMLYVYRSTKPSLEPFGDALPLLDLLRDHGIATGIVTDGLALVQQNKVESLGLDQLVDTIVYTDAIGDGTPKPATTGFEVASGLLRSDPRATAYVANDLRKDFVGPRRLGMTGVLVTRRVAGSLDTQPEDNLPHDVVTDLSEVATALRIKEGKGETIADSG